MHVRQSHEMIGRRWCWAGFAERSGVDRNGTRSRCRDSASSVQWSSSARYEGALWLRQQKARCKRLASELKQLYTDRLYLAHRDVDTWRRRCSLIAGSDGVSRCSHSRQITVPRGHCADCIHSWMTIDLADCTVCMAGALLRLVLVRLSVPLNYLL